MHLEYFDMKLAPTDSNECLLQNAVEEFTRALLPLLSSYNATTIKCKLDRQSFDGITLEVTDQAGSIKIRLTARLD